MAAKLNMEDLLREQAKQMTVNVKLTIPKGFLLRMKIATGLIWIATKIIGANYKEERCV